MYVRSTLALLAAVALALPGAASAQVRSGRTGTALGLLLGFEDGNGDTGLALRVDGEFPLQALSPQVRLSMVGSVGYSRWTYNAGFFTDRDNTLGILKFTPAVRFSFGQHPLLRPYADAGLGLHYARFTVRFPDGFGGVDSRSESDIGVHMRFAGGLLFQVTPGFSLGGELDLIPYFGDVDDNTFGLLFHASFRL
jgi:hypothetical protein